MFDPTVPTDLRVDGIYRPLLDVISLAVGPETSASAAHRSSADHRSFRPGPQRGGVGVLGETSEHGDESLRANDSRMVAIQSGGPRPLVPPLDLIAADTPPASFHALRTLKWIYFELLFIVGSLMSRVPPWSLRNADLLLWPAWAPEPVRRWPSHRPRSVYECGSGRCKTKRLRGAHEEGVGS